MHLRQTFCLVGYLFSNANDKIEYEKVNPKTQKLDKNKKRNCDICGRNKSQFFTK